MMDKERNIAGFGKIKSYNRGEQRYKEWQEDDFGVITMHIMKTTFLNKVSAVTLLILLIIGNQKINSY